MGRHGKKYTTTLTKVDRTEPRPLNEAIGMVKQMAFAKFDETVEVAIKVNLKKGHTVRDTTVLPHQFQQGKKILVFARGEKADEAREAGAAYVGDTDLVEKIKEGWLDFDVAVATPDMMKEVGKLGPILGRRGLMPNPKTQTVTFNIKEAIDELQKGRLEFRADKTGVVHLAIGKVSMEVDKIEANAQIFIDAVKKRKPADLKGEFIKSISISSTMSPGVRIVDS
jgi:large subunit ribosomal protein L1